MSAAAKTGGRDKILSAVRTALGASAGDENRAAVADKRIQAHSSNLIPARGGSEAVLERFAAEADRAAASVETVASLADVPRAVAGYLSKQNLPARVRITPDPWLADAPWKDSTALDVDQGPAVGSDIVGVSHAFGGVAETGTLVFLSGADNPTTVNFLPETHVAVVKASDVKGCYEDIWAAVRAAEANPGGDGFMPRTVNWITGPSRSADIELTLFLGAHGPRGLHIIIVDDEAAAASQSA